MAPRLRCLAGTLYHPGLGFLDGWVLHDGARVVERGGGKPPVAPEAEGVVLPTPVNAHTHVGDAVARGIDVTGRTLAEVVAPPDGIKHRILRETPREALVGAMREALAEMVACGARAFIDFREGGAEGVSLLRQACTDLPVAPVVLGRPARAWSQDEGNAVLDVADGFGLSALADVPDDVPEQMAELAHRRDKRFALHLSEGRREDVGRALDLGPDFLVHAVFADEDDLAEIAAEKVPVVVCPRSNALFGRLPDVRGMLDAGIILALGSDNAMFHPLDVLQEARLLARAAPDVAPLALLDAAILGGRRVLGAPAPADFFAPGAPADFVVLVPVGASPIESVLGEAPPRVLLPPSGAA